MLRLPKSLILEGRKSRQDDKGRVERQHMKRLRQNIASYTSIVQIAKQVYKYMLQEGAEQSSKIRDAIALIHGSSG